MCSWPYGQWRALLKERSGVDSTGQKGLDSQVACVLINAGKEGPWSVALPMPLV